MKDVRHHHVCVSDTINGTSTSESTIRRVRIRNEEISSEKTSGIGPGTAEEWIGVEVPMDDAGEGATGEGDEDLGDRSQVRFIVSNT